MQHVFIRLQWREYCAHIDRKINTYSMKQILYGEHEPQASILCELWLGLWRHLHGFKIL